MTLAIIAKYLLKLLVAYAVLVLVMALLQTYLLFHPTSYVGKPENFGLNGFKEVKFVTEDQNEITGWFKKADKPGKAIILFYGNADSLANYPEFFKKMDIEGYTILGVNYRGYAGTKGKPSEQGLYQDAKAAIKFLSQYEPTENTIFIGRSLGTGVATEIATKRKFKGLVLISPYTSIVNVASEIYWYLPVKYVARYKFASIDKIADVSEPVLIIHGREDKLIPLNHAEKLLSAVNSRKELKIYENTGHNDIDMNRVADDIIEFFDANRPIHNQ